MLVAEEVTMDRLLKRFRREAKARPNQTYPEQLRRMAAKYARKRVTAGKAIAAISKELGVAEQSLRNWMRADTDFRRVQVTEPVPAEQSDTGTLVLISPSGYRLEGLDMASAFQLLRTLR